MQGVQVLDEPSGAGGEVEVRLDVPAAGGRQGRAQRRRPQGCPGPRRAPGCRREERRDRSRLPGPWDPGRRRRRRRADGRRPSPRARRWAARRGRRCCPRPTARPRRRPRRSPRAGAGATGGPRPGRDRLDIVVVDAPLDRRLLDTGADDPHRDGAAHSGRRGDQRLEPLLLHEPSHRQHPEPVVTVGASTWDEPAEVDAVSQYAAPGHRVRRRAARRRRCRRRRRLPPRRDGPARGQAPCERPARAR